MKSNIKLWQEGPIWSETGKREQGEAEDISLLRESVERLNAPYLEVQFNQRVIKIKKRWPLLAYDLSTINTVDFESNN